MIAAADGLVFVAPEYNHSFPIGPVGKVFADDGRLLDDTFVRRADAAPRRHGGSGSEQ